MTEMGTVDHTNPATGEPFSETFRRGVVIVADGGERGAGPEDDQGAPAGDADRPAEMADIEHEPPNEGATRSFERGTEGRDRTV